MAMDNNTLTKVSNGFQEIPSGAIPSKVKDFMGSNLFSGFANVPVGRTKQSNQAKLFMQEHRGWLPEMQCFAKVIIESFIQDEGGAFHERHLPILSWTSLQMPQPSINFSASKESMYKPVFGGISGPDTLTVGYQDFSNLRISSALWAYYASQFNKDGYLMRSVFDPVTNAPLNSKVWYNFYNFYDEKASNVQGVVIVDPLEFEMPNLATGLLDGGGTKGVQGKQVTKDGGFATQKSRVLWSVVFEGVVFKEPQIGGVSPTMGTMARSFQFTYTNYKVTFPKPLGDDTDLTI